MINGKLTQKDITLWCTSHYCNSDNCKYMTDWCHIRDYALEECNECIDKSCRRCDKYRQMIIQVNYDYKGKGNTITAAHNNVTLL